MVRTSGKGFQTRLTRLMEREPALSRAEAIRRVVDSYKSKDPELRQRQLSGLIPGCTQAKRQGKQKGRSASGNTGTKHRTAQDLAGVNIIDFAEDHLGLNLYPAQKTILKAVYGLKLTADEFEIYRTMTDLDHQHGLGEEAVEILLNCGARGGKSTLASVIALFEAIVKGEHWRQYLQPGEAGHAVIIATRQQQAEAIIQANAARYLLNSDGLADWIVDEPLRAELRLRNGHKIISLPCNSTAGRGLPIFFLAFDEAAHFRIEGIKADFEIYNSLSPRLAQFSGGKTGFFSTPAARQGQHWEWYHEGFMIPGRATFQVTSKLMNPTLDDAFLERQKARDIDNYRREFEAEFAERVAAYLPSEKIDAASTVIGDVPPQYGKRYHLGIDQSGLSGRDRFAAAVSHKENDQIIIDSVRSWDSVDADEILMGIKQLKDSYRIHSAIIDRYAGGWVRSALEKLGLRVETRETLPVIYSNFKSLLLAGRLQLHDNHELRNGLINTVGYYGKNNSLSIGHERGASGHADLADAVATATWAASRQREQGFSFNVLRGILTGR